MAPIGYANGMDRSSMLTPLIVFIGLNVALDAVVGIAVISSKRYEPEMMGHFLLAGLLWGQFGLCCGARLRFEAMRRYTYIGMVVIPIMAIGIFWPTLGLRRGAEFIAMVMLAVGFTALFCMGPRSLTQWKGPENRFTLQQMLAGTVFIAFACVIVMHLSFAVVTGFSILILALPSVIASNFLIRADNMIGYGWTMFAGMLTCFLFTAVQPMAVPLFGMYMAQIMVLWIGGIFLISAGQGSARREVVGLPEEEAVS